MGYLTVHFNCKHNLEFRTIQVLEEEWILSKNVAINQGKTLARNLKSLLSNKPQSEYEYVDLGSMATVGKHKAVVDLPFIRFQGYLAWFVWMFLHLMLILSVRNKLIIFFNWAWSYITKDTSLRLIFGEKKRNL